MKNKVCIIGFNYSYKVLLKSFLVSRKFNVIGISAKSNRKNINLKNIKYFTSWKKMIVAMKPNIIAIGVPPKEQEKILLFILKKKINFLCEKPISDNNRKLSLFSKLSNKINCTRLVDLNFVTIPSIQKFRYLINKEKYNKLTKINIDWFFKPRSLTQQSNWKNKKNQLGDEINNFFFHLISIIDYIFGDLKVKLIKRKNYYYIFQFNNKKLSINVNFNSRSKKNLFRIKFNNMFNTIELINKSKDYHNYYNLYKNKKRIYSKNFDIKKSRILASKNILDIFLGKNKKIKKYVDFKKAINIQKKINSLI